MSESLSHDLDIMTDGGTLHFTNAALEGIFDERQLSNDLDQVKITDEYLPRGRSDGNVEPKPENRDSCMFPQGQSYQPPLPGGTAVMPQYSVGELSTGNGEFPLYQGNSYMGDGQCFPQQWRQPPSLSSNDLDMDRDPSITPLLNSSMTPPAHFQPKLETSEHNVFQGNFIPHHGHQYGNGHMYPHEDKLVRYNDMQNVTDATVSLHQQWQANQTIHTQQIGSPQSQHGQDAMETEIVHHTVEIDEAGEGPLHILSALQNTKLMARSLDMIQRCGVVDQCINLQNKYKQTPLFLAAQARNIGFCSWLLQNGADPNIQGTVYVDHREYIWRSPLHLVAMMGDEGLGLLNLFLTKSHKTDVNILSHGDKLTPLHVALKHHTESHSCRQMILQLIEKNADVTIREQSSSKTPFIMAIETRDLNLVKEFLERFTADRRRTLLQEQTRAGDTCLHIAAGLSRILSQQKVILLRLLVTNGANGNIQNNVKELPKDFARAEWEKIRQR